jgi:cytochrome c peroxidase
VAAARGADGRLLLAVSERHAHLVALIEVAGGGAESAAPSLRLLGRAAAGRLPAGLAFRAGASRLLVACQGEGEVWEIDVSARRVARRLAAVEGVRLIALPAEPSQRGGFAEDCGRLIALGRTEAVEIDLASGAVLWRHAPAAGKALNLGGLVVAGDRVFLTHQVKPGENIISPQMIVWGLILVNRVTVISRARLLAEAGAAEDVSSAREWVLPLDLRSRAAGDPAAVAVVGGRDASGSGAPASRLLVASSGTGRLLVLDDLDEPPYAADPLTREDPLAEVRVGGRPLAALAAGSGSVWVADALGDRVLEVDPGARRVLRELRLGPPPEATPAHLGAVLFHDADRSRGGWYSCHSCHPDGGTDGHTFDTSADGDGLAKRSPALHGVALTGPWSWTARFDTLRSQVAASMERTMAVDDPPSSEDVERVLAFLAGLRAPSSTRAGEDLGGDPERGREVFREAECDRCHRPPHYTTPGLQDVGLADEYDGNRRFNPPSLLGVRDRPRFLHDGRAASLESVFRDHDAEGLHGKAGALDPARLHDLLAFLKTLEAPSEGQWESLRRTAR